ncbi:MAG: hypothetical protein Phog2KO_49500 [Phototrophicaceae bacterium]
MKKKKRKATQHIKTWIFSLLIASLLLIILKIASYSIEMTTASLSIWAGIILIFIGGVSASNSIQMESRTSRAKSTPMPNQDNIPMYNSASPHDDEQKFSANVMLIGFFSLVMGILLNIYWAKERLPLT